MTKVKFYKQDDESILAVFPDEPFQEDLYNSDLVMSYQHIGQHGACSLAYADELEEATEKEYKELLYELIDIGYDDLDVELEEYLICPACNGSGEDRFDGTVCHACGGSGVEE